MVGPGFAQGPGGVSSSTAQTSGVVQFVTPSIVTSIQNLVPPFALFGRLTLHFVPEPSSPLALGSGAAALLALGYRRRR